MGAWNSAMERYMQQMRLSGFGQTAQEQLKHSKVVVIGAGGIGCPLLMYLCSMGVGHITLIDGDRVELSNLHRQILYTEDDIGQLKVHVAKRKLSFLNPDVRIKAIDVYLTRDNALELCEDHDVLIEGTDQPGVRLICDEISRKLKIPYVYGSIYQMQGQIAVFNYAGSLSYRDFFEISGGLASNLPTCSGEGVLPAVAGIVGSLMAGECVKLLTNIGEPLLNGILVIDIKNNHYIQFVKEGSSTEVSSQSIVQPAVKTITAVQLQEWMESKIDFQLLDVRETFERQTFHIGGEHIPYSQFRSDVLSMFRRDIPLVIYCQHGIRSAHVAEMFNLAGFEQVFSLAGGLEAYYPGTERISRI